MAAIAQQFPIIAQIGQYAVGILFLLGVGALTLNQLRK